MKTDSTAVNEPPSETPDATAKEKKQTEPDPSNMPPDIVNQLEYTHNPLDSKTTTTTEPTNETAAIPAPKDPAATFRIGADKKLWPFSIHTGESTHVLKPHVNIQLALALCRTRDLEFQNYGLTCTEQKK